MKIFNKYTSLLVILSMFIFSCEDEELKEINFPVWDSGVNGFGQFQSTSALNFLKGDLSVDLNMDFQWVSADGQASVSKIEFYVNFTESYINKDGDPASVDHGAVLVSTVDSPPGNRENVSLSLSQADVAPLYSEIAFDYDEDGTATPLFNNPDKPTRNATTSPFIEGDSFIFSWILYTADGRVFDSWSPSVCTELPGSNCQLSWITECGQIINQPAQDYTLVLNDSYGDGWNDAALSVIIDGVATDYTIVDGSAETFVVTVPAGTTSLQFEFISGDWDSEVTFSITTEKGNVIAAGGPSPPVGILTLDLCLENS